MIKWLVDFSLRFRGVVITLGIVVLGYGMASSFDGEAASRYGVELLSEAG